MIGVAAEYDALRRHSAVIDRSDRGRVRFTGDRAAATLNGLVTNDVAATPRGGGVYAAALNAKGKIVADLRVFVDAGDGSVLVDCPGEAWDGWWDLVRKYVNPRLAKYRDERAAIHDLGVFGPEAAATVAMLTGVDPATLAALEMFGQTTTDVAGTPVTVARVPDLSQPGFDLFATADTVARMIGAARAARVVVAGREAWDIVRIESGRPAWGIDIDDSTIPQEANFDELGALSYTKGCYTGQEVVARIHFRGHVNRRLMGLRGKSAEPPQRGAALIDAAGKTVGDVRSTATSPRIGGIALGMVRREIESGAELTAKWSDGEQTVQVVGLPFPG